MVYFDVTLFTYCQFYKLIMYKMTFLHLTSSQNVIPLQQKSNKKCNPLTRGA